MYDSPGPEELEKLATSEDFKNKPLLYHIARILDILSPNWREATSCAEVLVNEITIDTSIQYPKDDYEDEDDDDDCCGDDDEDERSS